MVIPINEIFGTLALLLGVAGCLLNNRKLRICFIVWLISNALNGFVHYRVDVWSLLIRDVVFSILVIEGWFRWGRKKTKEKASRVRAIGRPEKAGEKMAHAMIEMIHLMYQKKTALKFLGSLIKDLQWELARRKND